MPSFTHSLNIIGRCTQMQRGAVLKELGVCGGQVPYLLRLCRCPGLTQEELAKALYFNKSTVTRQDRSPRWKSRALSAGNPAGRIAAASWSILRSRHWRSSRWCGSWYAAGTTICWPI